MRQTLGVLSFVICLNMTATSMAAPAADAGEQDFAKGESLLKQKQYAEARATLEAGLIKNSSHVQAHFNLAEACRGLGAWDCAEEHYETALHLDAKSRITGTREARLSKMKVWQSLEEVTAWRLLENAKGLLAGGQAQSDKIKQAEEDLDGAHELGLNNEQLALYQQLQAKIPRRRSPTSPDSLRADGLAEEALQTDPRKIPMALVPAGEFTMGSTLRADEKPVRRVYLNAFSMDMYAVTVGQYAKYLETTGMEAPPEWDIMNQPQHQKRPVVNISWSDAASYCKWAGKRLPTEAEWEKAARGTDGRLYPWGNEAPTRLHANFGKKEWAYHMALVPVGMFELGKSPYGIHDMAGNVWEWVNDWYDHDYYKKSPMKNPQGPTTGKSKVVRGGNWLYLQESLRSSFRFNADPSGRQFGYGFRCAKTP
jgi:formylglycine-generating enzyme required for sulfatase activity